MPFCENIYHSSIKCLATKKAWRLDFTDLLNKIQLVKIKDSTTVRGQNMKNATHLLDKCFENDRKNASTSYLLTQWKVKRNFYQVLTPKWITGRNFYHIPTPKTSLDAPGAVAGVAVALGVGWGRPRRFGATPFNLPPSFITLSGTKYHLSSPSMSTGLKVVLGPDGAPVVRR